MCGLSPAETETEVKSQALRTHGGELRNDNRPETAVAHPSGAKCATDQASFAPKWCETTAAAPGG